MFVRTLGFVMLWLCLAAVADEPITATDAPDTNGATSSSNDKTEFSAAYQTFQDLSRARKYFDALPYAEQCYRLGSRVYGPEDKNTAALAMNLAITQLNAARHAEALTTFDIAIGLYEKSYGKNALEVIAPLMARGDASDIDTAGTYYDHAIKVARNQPAPDEMRIAELNLQSGMNLQQHGGSLASGVYLKSAYGDYQRLLPPEDTRFGSAAFWLGRFYLSTEKFSKSLPYFTEAVAAFEADGGATARLGAIAAHAMLVNAYSQLHDSDNATYHCLAAGKLRSTDEKDSTPLYRVNPFYPGAARARHDQGWVQIQFTIDSSGSVRDPKVIDSEGNDGFRDAGLAALKQWRYAPRFVDGKPVDTEDVQVVLRFELEK